MTHPIISATTLEGLRERYGEEPRREELCKQVREFIDIWDAACAAAEREA
jgi:hypothetical protein